MRILYLGPDSPHVEFLGSTGDDVVVTEDPIGGTDPNFWSFCEDTPKGVTIHTGIPPVLSGSSSSALTTPASLSSQAGRSRP